VGPTGAYDTATIKPPSGSQPSGGSPPSSPAGESPPGQKGESSQTPAEPTSGSLE
jgi:hypothetical protein